MISEKNFSMKISLDDNLLLISCSIVYLVYSNSLEPLRWKLEGILLASGVKTNGIFNK